MTHSATATLSTVQIATALGDVELKGPAPSVRVMGIWACSQALSCYLAMEQCGRQADQQARVLAL